HSVYAPEEFTAIHYRESKIFQMSKENKDISRILDEEIFTVDSAALVLTDSFNSYEIILNSRHPDRFVNTTDRDFAAVLDNPLEHGAEYILVPPPEGLNLLNAVLSRYYGFYDKQHEWVELEREL